MNAEAVFAGTIVVIEIVIDEFVGLEVDVLEVVGARIELAAFVVEGFFGDEGTVDAGHEVDFFFEQFRRFTVAELFEDVVFEDGEDAGE